MTSYDFEKAAKNAVRKDLEEQRMNSEEYKSLKENADFLKENALAKCNLEVNKARNYYEGYQQAIWDLMKYVKKD